MVKAFERLINKGEKEVTKWSQNQVTNGHKTKSICDNHFLVIAVTKQRLSTQKCDIQEACIIYIDYQCVTPFTQTFIRSQTFLTKKSLKEKEATIEKSITLIITAFFLYKTSYFIELSYSSRKNHFFSLTLHAEKIIYNIYEPVCYLYFCQTFYKTVVRISLWQSCDVSAYECGKCDYTEIFNKASKWEQTNNR
ncbi:hypothetical protein HMPREF3034_00019 [Prevotella sp. DNF00663]|nr:hypothetical protein HMPREF3034_00019 [Prevotella sp. DNF00663]